MPDFPFLGGTAAGLPSDQELLAIADPNPRNQQQRLDAGRPDEVLRLAEDFSAAGGDMTQAHEFSSLAQRWISQGMTRDGTPVYDQTTHLKALPGDFAALGPQMVRASRTLGDAAAHLKGAQGVAAEALGVMYAALDSARRDWADLVARLSARPFVGFELGGVDDQLKLGRELIIGSMQQAIRDAAAKITPVLSGYEDQLGAVLADVRKLGYLPPESFDGGPAADGSRVDEAAATDGRGLRDALDQPAGPGQLAAVDAASGHLRDLQHKLETGGQLDAEDRSYLKTFYETAGSQAIGGLPGHVRDSVAAQGLDPAAAKARYEGLVTPFGDTITGMAGGTVADPGGHQRAAGYADLPPSVQSLIDTRKGVIDPETGVRMPNERFIQGTAATDIPGGGVTGMPGYRGITDILATSKIDPSPDLAKHMIESAVRTRQDLNTVEEMGQHKVGSEPSTVAALHAAADASAAETALKFGARSAEGSSAALLDDRTRPALMGLNWQDGTGAAAVIDAGTNRDPASGGGHEAQARAALAVIQEAQRDPVGYLGKPAVPGDPGHPGRMAGPVIDAVDTVGIRYLDAFARSPLGSDFPSAAVNENRDPVGRPLGWSLNLSPDDQQGFLNFVSASGDQQLTRFHTAADIYNQHMVADALRHGDGAEVNSALGQAGHLDGSLSHAAEHQVSLVAEHGDLAASSARAAQIASRSEQAALNIAVTIGKEAIGAIPGVAAVKVVASPALAVLADMAKGGVSLATIADSSQPPMAPATTASAIELDKTQIALHQTVLLTTAVNDAGLFPGGPPDLLTADHKGPGGVDRPDGLVDPPGAGTQLSDDATKADQHALARWNRAHSDVIVSPDTYALARDLAAAQGVAPPQRQDSDWNHRPVDLQYGPDPVDRTPFLRWDPP